MKSLTPLLSLLFFTMVVCHSCGQSPESHLGDETLGELGSDFANDKEAMEVDLQAPQTDAAPSPSEVSQLPAKIIKNGSVSIMTGSLEESKHSVDSLLKLHRGFYELEKYETNYRSISYQLVIRVPQERFEILIGQLENGVGKLEAKSLSADDVTAEFVDLEIRLENKLAYLAQYKEVLKKARTIAEILEVKEKIRYLEEEIEAKKGRLKVLNNQVDLSTLSLLLTQQVELDEEEAEGFWSQINKAIGEGTDGFKSFLVFLVGIWPFLVLLTLFLFLRQPILRALRKVTTRKSG